MVVAAGCGEGEIERGGGGFIKLRVGGGGGGGFIKLRVGMRFCFCFFF
jgi:hypothetical protein